MLHTKISFVSLISNMETMRKFELIHTKIIEIGISIIRMWKLSTKFTDKSYKYRRNIIDFTNCTAGHGSRTVTA
jgi:hypothetical protein